MALGLSLGLPCASPETPLGLSLRHPWDSPEIPLGLLGLPWGSPGVSWDSPGTPSGLSWDPPGTLLGLSRDSPGTLLGLPGTHWDSSWLVLDLLVLMDPPASSWLLLAPSGSSWLPLAPPVYILAHSVFSVVRHSRMWCLHDIGRDSWVWGEQETL